MEISQHVRAILSFVEAADAQSFSGAAKKLGISSAAISKNVANLEQVLGVRLMNRTTRRVSLTEEGDAFLSQARIALNALENAVDNIVTRKMDTSGRVRISTSASFGNQLLMPALPGLLTRYPLLSIEADFDDRMIDLVKDGYDLTLRGGRIVDSSLITRPICHLKTILVASPEYLARYGEPKSPADLFQHRLLIRRFLGGRISQWGFKNRDGGLSLFDPVPAALTLSAPEAVVQAAISGVGIAQVAVHLAYEYLEQGKLKILLWEQYDNGNYEMVLQYPHRSFIAPRVKVTVDYLLAHFNKVKSIHLSLDELEKYIYENT